MVLPFTRSHTPHAPTLEGIYRAHWREIVDLARWLGAPARETEDVAQVVFMTLHRAIQAGRFTFDAPARPWLIKTTCLITRDYVKTLRRQGYPIDLQGVLEPMDGTPDAEQNAQASQLRDLLQELLDGLDQNLREVFVLHEIKGLTLPEIAEQFNIPITTARHRLREARVSFEEALRRRRAEDLRKYGAAALMLPISSDAVLRLARTLPPEVALGAEERIWARVQREIGLDAAAHQRPRRPRALRPRPPYAPKMESWVITGLAFVVGVIAGAMALDLYRRPAPPPRPPRDPAPVVAVVPPVEESIPAPAPVPAPVPDNTTTAAPSVPPSAPVDMEAEAERHCLQKASELLDAAKPQEALTELVRCEQRFPQTRFPARKDKLRRDVETALGGRTFL